MLNSYFDRWGKRIREDLTDHKGQMVNPCYEDCLDLLATARDHRSVFSSKSELAERVVILVHPFYLLLTCPACPSTEAQIADAREYYTGLKKIVAARRTHSEISLIIFESLPHYAAASSLLLEQGSVDDVVFTRNNSGYLLERSDLFRLRGKELMLCGGYNRRCFTSAMVDTLEVCKGDAKSISVIEGMVLDSPHDRLGGLTTRRENLETSLRVYPHLDGKCMGILRFDDALSLLNR